MADSDQAPALREAAARLLKGLNAEQRLAVTAGEGATVVVAGPGSGKTRVITRRAAWLIEHGVAPSEVVLMTFTRKAAREMRERLDQLLAQSGAASGAAAAGQHRAGQIMAGTFHSLALRFLRRYSHLLNLSQNFTQIDTESRNRILRDFIKECKKAAPEGEESEKSLKPSVVGNNISRIKMMRLTPSEAQQELRRLEQHSELSPENSDLYNLLSSTLPCYEHYAAVCEREGLIDYDDMLLKCEELFSKAPHVVKPYSHILVDEFQDTNPVQYDMVRHLAHSGNLFVVGDPNQSIYGWRAAQADGYRRIFADFPGTKQVSLAENYRSTGAILSLSSDLINQNQELSRCNLPYRMVNGVRFFEREEIADLVAYLRLVLNPDDNSAFTRVFNRPRRQLGAKALASLLESAQTDKTSLLVAAQHSSNKNARQFARIITDLRERLGHVDLPELVLHLIETIQFKEHLRRSFADKDKRNYESRLENVEELVAYARNVQEQAQEAQHEAPLDSAQPLTPQDMGLAQLRLFMDQATLHSTADVEDQDDAITLSTVHSAKGLEWAVVAIPGVEDGLYPHANAKRHRNPTKQVAALHEERRLLYVGIAMSRVTRARLPYPVTGHEKKPARSLQLLAMPIRVLGGVYPSQVCATPVPGQGAKDLG
ncbi:uncharacterized protein MONBRDRAFT_8248 [Monosiga brevicollis MX1]|uniref:DNA 3'-5' helicase n=1 Tax=Monosiga brevicollis TaxID=81824 RepID=A9UZH4_MONBE|nr:uncharacterized protein MONBRDRAFT_8248 [Monosiga brevicollis MX1]EDQ89369.1 predicted protein [Monosiga brevicollis MX1]|eukprot:XP_001745945.1 hypothetical protein [Monosiga brevicollis MX1]